MTYNKRHKWNVYTNGNTDFSIDLVCIHKMAILYVKQE